MPLRLNGFADLIDATSLLRPEPKGTRCWYRPLLATDGCTFGRSFLLASIRAAAEVGIVYYLSLKDDLTRLPKFRMRFCPTVSWTPVMFLYPGFPSVVMRTFAFGVFFIFRTRELDTEGLRRAFDRIRAEAESGISQV